MTRIKKVRLSENQETSIVDDKNGINGKINVTKDGRKFFLIELENTDNPFKTVSRIAMYSTDDDGNWPGADPKRFLSLVGSDFNGCKVVSHNVEPYTIDDKKVNQYTTIIMPHENEVKVFASSGHNIVVNTIDEESGELRETILGEKKKSPIIIS